MVTLNSLAYHFSNSNRHKKWRFFIKEFVPRAEDLALDVGFSEREFSCTTNYIEKHYPYPNRLSALGVEEPKAIIERYPNVSFRRYDGAIFPFADQTFDLLWSNAVIEHVGDYSRQVAFLKEIRRVAKHFFITTPNLYFPVEVHTRTPFLHYLGKERFDWYLRRRGQGWATDNYMHLLSRKQIARLCIDAGVTNCVIRPNRLFGFILEYWIYTPRDNASWH